MKWQYITQILLAVLLSVLTGIIVHQIDLKHQPTIPLPKIITHIDTVFKEKPVEVYKEVLKFVEVPVKDTLNIHDTLFMMLPIESKHYTDSLYDAWVSGYNSSLDSISVYNRTITKEVIIEVPKKYKPMFTFGVQVGLGAQYGLINRKFDLGPYLGVGIQYNF